MSHIALRRLLPFVVLLMLPAVAVRAEDRCDSVGSFSRHSLSFSIGGGLHSLNPSFTGVDYEGAKPGGCVGFDYDFSLSQLVSLGSGFSVSSYASSSITTDVVITPDALDLDGESFVHTLTLDRVAERQCAIFAELPLRLSFHFPVSRSLGFSISAQAHLSVLLADRYKASGGLISTIGYYPQYRLTFDSDMPENGFYSFSPSYSGSAGLRRAGFGLGGRIGVCRSLSSSLGLIFSLYGKYSFSDVLPSNRGSQFAPDCRRADGYSARYNGALASSCCNSAHPLAVGLSVGLRLSLGRRAVSPRRAAPSAEVSAPQPAASPVIAQVPLRGAVLAQPKASEVADSVVRKIDTDIQSLIDHAGGIRFDIGSGALLGESAQAVARIADILNDNPDLAVAVTGHTCDVGTVEANLRIGMERAEAVARCLEDNGVDESRIRTFSAGASQPVAPNDTEENRMLNRRVVIEVKNRHR
ncbi:MAG: OmpA family protein [Marinilabiliaceae bacterium]